MSIFATFVCNCVVAAAFLFVWVRVVHEHETASISQSYAVVELSTILRERKSTSERATPTLISHVVNIPSPASIHDRSIYIAPSLRSSRLESNSKLFTSVSARRKPRSSVMLLSSTVTWRGMQDFERIEMNKGIIEARTLADNELKQRLSGCLKLPLLSRLTPFANFANQAKATSFEQSLPYSPRPDLKDGREDYEPCRNYTIRPRRSLFPMPRSFASNEGALKQPVYLL
ncbi:hypothetical protein JCM5353_007292 [Sporobolomyces roseus]